MHEIKFLFRPIKKFSVCVSLPLPEGETVEQNPDFDYLGYFSSKQTGHPAKIAEKYNMLIKVFNLAKQYDGTLFEVNTCCTRIRFTFDFPSEHLSTLFERAVIKEDI